MKTKPLAALLLALAATPACSHFSVAPASDTFEEGRSGRGRLLLREDLAIACVGGSPDEIGSQLAALAGGPIKDLLSSWRWFEVLRSLFTNGPPEGWTPERDVPEDHRREVEAMARAAGVSPGNLLGANAAADSCACTAFVASGAETADGSLLFGRNLDFAPSHVLGPRTLVLLVRPTGKRAFVSVGFPGMAAVASGMNQDGLAAAILVNHEGGPRRLGTPLGFVVRRLLEECGTVEEARALFRTLHPASGHFVFVADPRTCAIVSADAPDRLPGDEPLICANGPVDPLAGIETDERVRAISDLLLENRGRIDGETARRILGAASQRHQNTHAIVFEPGRLALSLARGTTFAPAALGPWDRIDLAFAFGDEGEDPVVSPLSTRPAFPHWKDHAYEGKLVDERLRRAGREAP